MSFDGMKNLFLMKLGIFNADWFVLDSQSEMELQTLSTVAMNQSNKYKHHVSVHNCIWKGHMGACE